ncbi:MAG: Virginiamycin lyase [Pseudomonadota bacterium]
MTNHRNDSNKEVTPGESGNLGHTTSQHNPTEPLGLKRRHFMGTALALDAAALLAACGGGGGGGDAAGSGSGSGSASGSSSASSSSSGTSSSSGSSSGSNSGSSSGSGSGSGSASPTQWVVTTLAGTGSTTPFANGTGGTATFNFPYGVAVDTSGNVFVADSNNHLIRKITPAGVVSTLAGTTGVSGSDNGQGNTSKFYGLTWIAVDGSGYLYVADLLNQRIRKITPVGVVSNWAGSSGLWGQSGYLDGTAGTARFYNPAGVALDTNGNLYLADSNNHLIRKITPAGEVSTLAGVALTMGYLDGTGGTAKFNSPSGVAVDTSGYVYVADYDNHLIRKISPTGVVSTLAGIGGTSGSANGSGGSATFNNPTGIAIDANGTLYVAEQTNHRVRKISPLGVVSTLAGVGSAGHVDGTGETAIFDSPSGIAVDTSGNLYVGDKSNNLIRKITPIYV